METTLLGDTRLPARFWEKVRVLDNGCWEWTGARTSLGYGGFGVGSRTDGSARLVMAHRWAHEMLVGPIPSGLESDHLCRFASCVNPGHIELVTHQENILRGDLWERRKTHCPQGHPYDEANTSTRSGKRHCRECECNYSRKWCLEALD